MSGHKLQVNRIRYRNFNESNMVNTISNMWEVGEENVHCNRAGAAHKAGRAFGIRPLCPTRRTVRADSLASIIENYSSFRAPGMKLLTSQGTLR